MGVGVGCRGTSTALSTFSLRPSSLNFICSRLRECLASAGLGYGGLGGPRQCVRKSQRASLAPRRSLRSLSARSRIDQIAEKSINSGFAPCGANDMPGHRNQLAELSRRLRFGKCPCASQDLRLGAIEAHQIVPSGRRRQAIGNLAVATPELDGERSVVARLGGDVVKRIG